MAQLHPEEEQVIQNLLASVKGENPIRFGWDENFQRRLLSLLLTDTYFLIQSQSLIKSSYFTNEAHVLACDALFELFMKYKSLPDKFILIQTVQDKLKGRDDAIKLAFMAEVESVYDYYVPGLSTREVLLDRLTMFSRAQSTRYACQSALKLIVANPDDEATYTKVDAILRETLLVQRGLDVGTEVFISTEEMFRRMKEQQDIKEKFTTGLDWINERLSGGTPKRGELYAWIGLGGRGKCWISNTPILMYDGTIKVVQDVVVGDLVMGDDSKPRKVLGTHRLTERKYEVRPVNGDSYFVNSKHILSLKNSHTQSQLWKDRGRRTGNTAYRNPTPCFANHPTRMGDTDIYNISVEDWFKQTNHFKREMRGWRIGVDFPSVAVKIDPYILGVWLGDGCKNTSGFTNADPEVVGAVRLEASQRGLSIRRNDKYGHFVFSEDNKLHRCGKGKSANNLLNDLRAYGLLHNKHVPQVYKANSREVRLQLLAGLLDTDGSLHDNGYGIVQKKESLADDICYLARSLGLAAYKKKCLKKCCNNGKVGTYYRVSISGDCSVIPVRIATKKAAPRKQRKDVLHTGIEVIDTGKIDEFYGFEVDGNHLFLLGDFTVVHNSLLLAQAATENVKLGHKVCYISLEMDDLEVWKRIMAQFTGADVNFLWDQRDTIKEQIDFRNKTLIEQGGEPNNLIIRQFPGRTIDVNYIRSYLAHLELYGFKPDVVIIDYVGELKLQADIPSWEAKHHILCDLRATAIMEKMVVLTAVQPNKSASELKEINQYIDESNLSGSFDQFQPLDGFWSINQLTVEKNAKIGRVFIIKHRSGKSQEACEVEFDYPSMRVNWISKDSYTKRLQAVSCNVAQDMDNNTKLGRKKKPAPFDPNATDKIEPSTETYEPKKPEEKPDKPEDKPKE